METTHATSLIRPANPMSQQNLEIWVYHAVLYWENPYTHRYGKLLTHKLWFKIILFHSVYNVTLHNRFMETFSLYQPLVKGIWLASGLLGDQNLLQCHILECHHTTLQCTSAHDQDKRIFPFHVSYHLSTVPRSDFHLLHTEKSNILSKHPSCKKLIKTPYSPPLLRVCGVVWGLQGVM